MRRSLVVCIGIIALLGAASVVSAQVPTAGDVLKSTTPTLTPEAQGEIDEAKTLKDATQQENFIINKAKMYLGLKNYQTALDLANYGKTVLNSKSLDLNQIIIDAKAALAKIAQDKVSAVLK